MHLHPGDESGPERLLLIVLCNIHGPRLHGQVIILAICSRQAFPTFLRPCLMICVCVRESVTLIMQTARNTRRRRHRGPHVDMTRQDANRSSKSNRVPHRKCMRKVALAGANARADI